MGDDDHFEINHLQRGTRIYQFGGTGQQLRLVSLICSDAFAFTDTEARAVYDRALVVHLQLNPKPRQTQYRQYRDRLLQFQGDTTELICLNWARDVLEWCEGKQKCWKNIGASAWYLRTDKFDERDETLCANHGRGLYYTWLEPLRSHALFFNYEPAVYLIEATKVAHIAVPASVSRRRGPQLTKTLVWDTSAKGWAEQPVADDGFSAIVGESGAAKEDIKNIADANPLAAERLLALCAGKIGHTADWYTVQQLDSCAIDASEVIHRVTFCQDTDDLAREFRTARLKRCGNLSNILKSHGHLPPALDDLKGGFHFDWAPEYPHQNVLSAAGQRATLIYVGEDFTREQAETTEKKAAAYLQRGFTDLNQSRSARQRLAVWFHENGGYVLCDSDRYHQIDKTNDASEVAITRDK